MVKHKKNYLEFFGYTEGDWIPCENCGRGAVEFHHLLFRSKGGGDEAENIMALCVSTPDWVGCHNKAHNSNREFNEQLKKVHAEKVRIRKTCH